ncbi:MAG: glycerophosphodiester phosphodiesterase family protein, partial [Ilumatobacteraceae bacterium]
MNRSRTRPYAASFLAIFSLSMVVACGDETSSNPSTEASDTEPATTEVLSTEVPATEAPTMAIERVVAPEASTVSDLLALDRPIVIVHAGGDFDYPHSTMYAFTESVLGGADVLEMDVMLSSDGVLMVQHDNTVDRLTNNTGLVGSYTAAELQAMDNAYWFSGGVWSDKSLPEDAYVFRGVRTGERPAPEGYTADDFAIPTFEQVARAFPDHVLDVEIKIPESEIGEVQLDRAYAAAAELARLIEELDRADSVIVVSFDDSVLTEFRSLIDNVATSPGQTSLVNWYLAGAPLDPRDVVFQAPPVYEGIEVLTAETFERAHNEGYEVWVWMNDATQETTEFYAELVARGADG